MSILIRLTGLLMVGLTALAIGLAKLSPPESDWRIQDSSGWINIAAASAAEKKHESYWLDVRNGSVSPLRLSDREVLNAASRSPWVDEKGRSQVVGRWSKWSGTGPEAVVSEFGLVRCSFPDGEVLDRVITEIVPCQRPCWSPGTDAEVVFAAADGRLYRYDFDQDRDTNRASHDTDRMSQPVPLEWHVSNLDLHDVFLFDPSWPDDPRLADVLIVGMRSQSALASSPNADSQLWWLKLDASHTAIETAGPLFGVSDRKANGRDSVDQRFPTVKSLPGGQLALAYLSKRTEDSAWRLTVSPLELDPTEGVPMVAPGMSQMLADQCTANPPAFTSDGSVILVLTRELNSIGRIIRIPTEAILAPRQTPIVKADLVIPSA